MSHVFGKLQRSLRLSRAPKSIEDKAPLFSRTQPAFGDQAARELVGQLAPAGVYAGCSLGHDEVFIDDVGDVDATLDALEFVHDFLIRAIERRLEATHLTMVGADGNLVLPRQWFAGRCQERGLLVDDLDLYQDGLPEGLDYTYQS